MVIKPLLLLIGGIGGTEVLLLSFFFLLPLYLLPSILARDKKPRVQIFLVNLFLGWTLLGWLASLLWALWAPSFAVASISPSAATHQQKTSAASVADELAKLRDLRDQGVLTQEEFERQKNNLLS